MAACRCPSRLIGGRWATVGGLQPFWSGLGAPAELLSGLREPGVNLVPSLVAGMGLDRRPLAPPPIGVGPGRASARGGRSLMGRTARILLVSWRAEIARSLTYRTDLAIGLVVNILWLAVAISPVLFAFEQLGADQSTIGDGWTLGELLYLQALWWLLDAVVWMILVPNMSDLSAQVASGQLDMMLLKPVHSLVYVTSRRLEVIDVQKLPLASAVGVYALFAPRHVRHA